MKTLAVILNTNQLGGAERSLIEQLVLMDPAWTFDVFYPELDFSDEELKKFLALKGIKRVKTFVYPKAIYQLSRKGPSQLPALILAIPVILWAFINWWRTFGHYENFYLNGLKASLPVFCWAGVLQKKLFVLWHFRDFPNRGIMKVLAPTAKNLNAKIMANSKSVALALTEFFPQENITTLYNLGGNLGRKNPDVFNGRLGIASMFAPWKGLHTVVLMAAMYEKELEELGIQEIAFYGKGIYQTKGEHNDYPEQLKKLSEKLKAKLVKFKGEKSPKEIFGEIDILIHPSLEPEPFGRVILEAQKSGLPVISTFEGGASELYGEGEFGVKFASHDVHGLFESIQRLVQDKEFSHQITEAAFKHALAMEDGIRQGIQTLLIKKT